MRSIRRREPQQGDQGKKLRAGANADAHPAAAAPNRFGDGGHLGNVLSDAAQISREVSRRRVALLRILLETPFDDPAEGGGHAAVDAFDGVWLLADDGGERFRRGGSLECALPRRQLVKDRAQRELVGAEVDGLSARLLRRHVPHVPSTGRRRLLRRHQFEPAPPRRFGAWRAEVENLDGRSFEIITYSGLGLDVDPGGCAFATASAIETRGPKSRFEGRERGRTSRSVPPRRAPSRCRRWAETRSRGCDDVRVVQRGGGARSCSNAADGRARRRTRGRLFTANSRPGGVPRPIAPHPPAPSGARIRRARDGAEKRMRSGSRGVVISNAANAEPRGTGGLSAVLLHEFTGA